MSVQELFPTLRELSRSQKWEIMQFLMRDLAEGELPSNQRAVCEIALRLDSHGAAQKLRTLLIEAVEQKVEKYRESVQALMVRYTTYKRDEGDVRVELVMDTVRDHYQWMEVGWKGSEYIYNCYIHIDIIDGKVWVQRNWTEENPAEDLVEMGVMKEDIVLGLHAPYKRPYTDYGVA